MTKHEWREQEGEEVRFWRANYHGGRFMLYTKAKDDDGWEKIDPPTKEALEGLRDTLWRKYQRKRVSWGLVAKVDKLLGRPPQQK